MIAPFRHTLGSWDRLQSRRLLAHSILIDGQRRSALLYVPRHMMDRGPLPLVVVFHGGSSKPESIARSSGLHKIAEREGFIVAYPSGTPAASGMTWTPSESEGPRKSDDVRFARKLINDLQRRYDIDPARVYAAGFSIGGALVYELADTLSERIAAIAVVASSMTASACQPDYPVSLIHIHGTKDRRVPFEGGKGPATSVKHEWRPVQHGIDCWREANGCAATPKTVRLGVEGVTCHHYSGPADVELWVVEGGRHAWPGGARDAADGEDAAEPLGKFSASEKIWSFFVAHPGARPAIPPRMRPRWRRRAQAW